ncbi:MAG: hypothetical protein J6Q35_04165 [Rikenellaceae bacterium]|nr:hypothetical protein [Rikenellaceae bacterium]
MRPILKFIFALFILATVNNVSAQSIRVTNGTRPIQLGDSVLVAVGWDNQPINEFYNVRAIEKIEFKGLIELTKEDLKKQRFAFLYILRRLELSTLHFTIISRVRLNLITAGMNFLKSFTQS